MVRVSSLILAKNSLNDFLQVATETHENCRNEEKEIEKLILYCNFNFARSMSSLVKKNSRQNESIQKLAGFEAFLFMAVFGISGKFHVRMRVIKNRKYEMFWRNLGLVWKVLVLILYLRLITSGFENIVVIFYSLDKEPEYNLQTSSLQK